ncbi:hypothetical protein TrST_g6869 [Triparma strigata]|uniref:C2 domain-containing protein n=1 Tax=Triparma strigata TaxID=1606541 RepID=A0A9W7BPF9_9STRA|nr:hypothetical protein TrST_g6869 [Triparma strigata]
MSRSSRSRSPPPLDNFILPSSSPLKSRLDNLSLMLEKQKSSLSKSKHTKHVKLSVMKDYATPPDSPQETPSTKTSKDNSPVEKGNNAKVSIPSHPFPVDILFEQHSLKPKTTLDFSSYTQHISDSTMDLILSNTIMLSSITFKSTLLTNAQLRIFVDRLAETGRLRSVTFDGVRGLTEGFVEECFYGGDSITEMNLISLPNLTNKTVKDLSKTLTGLKKLTISKCGKVSDEGIINVSKNCVDLEYLDISGLGRLTDHTLVRMATGLKKLNWLDISSNPSLSDVGLLEVLKILRSTTSLRLNSLPLLTDASLRLIHEYPVVYGFRPHDNFSKLVCFSISDNDHITDSVVSYLSTATLHSLKDLTIKNCSNIGTNASFFGAISSLTLTSLTLSSLPNLTDAAFCNVFGTKKKKLHHLCIVDCPMLTDESFEAIAACCKNITSFSFGNQPLVTSTSIANLIKANKKLQTFSAMNMKRLTDEIVNTLSRKTLHIKSLTLSNCKQLTDAGLKTVNSLKSLEYVDLSYNFLLSGNAIRLLPPNNLRTCNFRGITKLTDSGIKKFAAKFSRVEVLDLSKCSKLTLQSVHYLLDTCTDIESLRIEGWEGHNNQSQPTTSTYAAAIPAILDKYPNGRFLTYDPNHDRIYVDLETTKHEKNQIEHHRYNFRLSHSAKCVQAAWRRLRLYRSDLKELKARNRMRVGKATICQSVFRMYFGKLRVSKIRTAKNKVARMLQARFRYRHLLHMSILANQWDIKRLKRKVLRILLLNHAYELEQKWLHHERMQWNAAIVHHRIKSMSRIFYAWQAMHRHFKHEKNKEAFANAHWGKRVIPTMLKLWKKKTRDRQARRRELVECFLYTTSISTDNSSRQLVKTELALDFYRKNLLCWVWVGFRRFLEMFSELLKKAKIASEHAQQNFKKRLLVVVFKALRKYKNDKVYKRVCMRKGEAQHRKVLKRKGFKFILQNAAAELKFRKDTAKAIKLFENTTKAKRLHTLTLYRDHRKLMKARKLKGGEHYDFRVTCVFLARWIDWKEQTVDMAQKTVVADSHFGAKTRRRVFKGWASYTKHAGDVKAMMKAKQEEHLKIISFSAWKRFWKEAAANTRRAKELAALAEENRELIYNASTDISRVFRSWRDRREAIDYRAFRDWAVLKCQNQFRVFHAKKVLLKKRRWFFLQQNLVEEKVEEQMAAEEAYMRWWMMMEAHAITIKRILLGHRGRVLAYMRRQEAFREKGIAFQEAKRSAMKFFRDQQALRDRMKVMRKDASILIQKMYRGLLGRRRYEELLQDKKEKEIASKVQAAFRGKQGRRRSDARRRYLANMDRVGEARKIQAKSLRRIGFKHRRQQRQAIRLLRAIGLESMGFTQKWRQQFQEVRVDMTDTYQEINRFITSWREGGLDPYLRDKTKRRMLMEHETDITPKIASAVRVIQQRHSYTGLTGQVVTIDRSFPTKAVAEVRMDVDGKIMYFQLITEPTMYDPPQPSMYRIDSMHNNGVPYEDVVRCKEYILMWAQEERVARDRFLAARRIQSLGRIYMAKMRVAKMRYRHWARLRSKRLAVLRALDVYSASHIQSSRIMLSSGLIRRTNVPILYEVPEFPPRIEEAMTMQTLRRMLNDEFQNRMLRRIAFTEVHEERLLEGTYRRRLRQAVPFKVLMSNAMRNLKKNTTSLIAQKVHDHGSQGGFVEKVAMFFGGTEWKRTDDERYAWMKRVTLKQLEQSPHARMNGLCLYHGVFKGKLGSKSHPFVPHGEGMAEFLQGFGVGREEKTLHISVIRAKELRAADFNNSDPFVVINCNRRKVKTKVVMKTLDPEWNEHFEIDITDPYHIIKVVVYDWDKYSSNDFLGQFVFPIADLADGKKVKKWYRLIGNDNKKGPDTSKKSKQEIDDENDLGEIELEMQWTEREDSDDIDRRRLQHKKVIIIQCWARQMLSKWFVLNKRRKVENQIKILGDSALMIQCSYRIRRAKKILKTMRVEKKNIMRIQCAVRQWISRNKATFRRLQYFAARSIQCCLRKHMAGMISEELARIRGLLRDESAATIQRRARLKVSIAMVRKQRAKMREKDPPHPSRKECLETIDEWGKTYGRDPHHPRLKLGLKDLTFMQAVKDYKSDGKEEGLKKYKGNKEIIDFLNYYIECMESSKRLQRICLKTFARVLSVKGNAVVTPYGEAGIEQFPAPYLETRGDSEFVMVKLFAHRKLSVPRDEKQAIRESSPQYLTAVKMSDVSINDTVGIRVITIQCLFRIVLANERAGDKRRARNAAILVQRKYRWRFRLKAKLALMTQCAWRRYLAMEELKFKKKEVVMAKKIQGNYRCHLGRLVLEEKRRVSQCEVLDSSGDLTEMFGASKVLDKNPDTFWCSGVQDVEKQWISFDLKDKFPIGRVKLWLPDNTAAPKEVLVERAHRIIGPFKPIETIRCKQGGNRWQSFDIPKTYGRYWRLSFKKNFGNQQAVSVIGAGFFIAMEVTAHVTEQPRSLMVSPGPPVGRFGGEIVLKSNADGWPPPKFQWTKNGVELDDETGPTLTISVSSKKSKTFKRFRCLHCKKINTELPMNLYRVICNNCKYHYDYSEVEEAESLRKPLQLETEEVAMQLKQLKNSRQDLSDDIKALNNKLKRDKFARDRGEVVEDESEKLAEEERQQREEQLRLMQLDQPSLEQSISQQSSQITADTGNTELKRVNNYKQMMKEFSTLEEPLVMSDDDSMTSAGGTIAGGGNAAQGGTPVKQIMDIGTVVSPLPSPTKGAVGENPQGGGEEKKEDAPAAPAAAGGLMGALAAIKKEGEPVAEEEDHHSDSGAEDENKQNDAASLASLGNLIGDFMERALQEPEPEKENETEVKIKELTKEVEEVDVKIAALEKKSWWLLRKRLAAGEHDPCKVQYGGEGVYVCVVSNVRGGRWGGGITRSNKSRPAIIFVDDPTPNIIKVYEEYHLVTRLRRRNWPKYLSLYGWFVEGMILGDCIVRYNDGSVYDGPYVDERWIDWMGRTVDEAFERDHWGVWLTPDDIVYEGPKVDNHFDVSNIQGEFRVTYQNGEVYEGEYVDERRHGIGEYHYLDGSVYEGQWFKNRRQGFGVYTTDDGSVYEGEWDRDYIHGEGIWRWKDGSSLMGDNIDGLRTGRGVYITDHGDVYVGEFKDNNIHGKGTFTYNDGTRYEGNFRNNLREGDAVFTYTNGVCDIGVWRNDRRDGEFVVRRPVYPDPGDKDQTTKWDDEVQHGIWDEGEFEEWLAPPVNPKATSEFITLFEDNPDEFDGVYAMLIARKLPLVPHGIQETHPKVQAIMKRIAKEGGSLVAFDTYQSTKDNLKDLEPVLDDAKLQYRHLRTNEEHVDTVIAGINREADDYDRKIKALENQAKTFDMAIETFWLEDHEDTREKFIQLGQNLLKLERSDWFQIRHYHEPPALIENVMSAVCMLMMETDTWKGAQALLGSSQQNRDDGDTEAVWQEYDVKLLFLLKSFDVFLRAEDESILTYVGHFLVDPRFKSDNYFLQSFGPAAVRLVEWIWGAYAYVKKAKEIKKKYDGLRHVKAAIGRFHNSKESLFERANKYEERASGLRERVQKASRRKDRWQAKYDKLEELLMKCQEMVVQYTSDDEHELDEYEKMLQEEGEVKATVESVIELMLQELESENEDPDLEELGMREDGSTLTHMIDKQVQIGREKMFRLGDYKFAGGKLVVTKPINILELQAKLGQDLVEQINFMMNEYPKVVKWTMLDGTVITREQLVDCIRCRWSIKDEKEAINAAERQWQTVYPASKHTAFMAIQSRTNFIMSENAKEEARIWMERHPEDVKLTETWMAAEFQEDYHEDTARVALEMKDEKKDGPELQSMADVWCRLNRQAVLDELDHQNKERARAYQEEHPDETAKSVLMFRNLTGEEGLNEVDVANATAWISLNLGAVVEAEEAESLRLAAEFVTKFGAEEDLPGAEKEEAEKEEGGEGGEEGKEGGLKPPEKKSPKKAIETEGTPDKDKKSTAREAVKLIMDVMASKEDRELAMAWANREENKEKFHLMQGQVNKELLHDDLVAGSNVKAALDNIKVWHQSLELRRTRLGLKTDKMREEEEIELEKERLAEEKRRAEEDERIRQEEEAERLREEEEEKERQKKGRKNRKPPAKKKKIARAPPVKKKEKPPEPEVTDEGVLKLMKDILQARVKIVNNCESRLDYNRKRLDMFEQRLDEVEFDKMYLEVSDRIRPSEAKVELHKQATLRRDRIKFLTQAIIDEKKIIEENEKILEEQRNIVFKETGEYPGSSAAGGEEWEQYYDEQYGVWAWYNNVTGEVQFE